MVKKEAKKVVLTDSDGDYIAPVAYSAKYSANGTDLDECVIDVQTALPHKLNDTQITNCILEIPQRIKYTLVDGTLTIKAGSIVIVPYGVVDLTAQYPVGSVFINNNFKVYDTQFEDGKFFVWAEVQSDIVYYQTITDTRLRPVLIDVSRNLLSILGDTTSSNIAFDGTGNNNNYRTDLNIIENTLAGVHNNYVMSLPLMTVMADAVVVAKTVEQIFNGFGYIGSTIWVDKGVKGLIPNGRNEDGSLKNIEYTTNKIVLVTRGYLVNNTVFWLESHGESYDGLAYQNVNNYSDMKTNQNFYYVVNENKCYYRSSVGVITEREAYYLGSIQIDKTTTTGKITSLNTKQPFRAVDYNDFENVVATTTIIESTMPNYAMPNYAKKVSKSTGTSYIADTSGWLFVQTGSSDDKSDFSVVIDGITFRNCGNTTAREHFYFNFMLPVGKGSSYKVNKGGYSLTVYFIPCKGV